MKDERDPNGCARIRRDGDHVRIEVATALSLNDLIVFPVLVDEAKMPATEDLPQDLMRLTRMNGVAVRHDPDFRRDMASLIQAIRNTQRF